MHLVRNVIREMAARELCYAAWASKLHSSCYLITVHLSVWSEQNAARRRAAQWGGLQFLTGVFVSSSNFTTELHFIAGCIIPWAGCPSKAETLTKVTAMALCGAYRRLATQVAGRLRYAPLCLTTAERAVHTTPPAFVPPEPKAVPIPKLKDRCDRGSVMVQT